MAQHSNSAVGAAGRQTPLLSRLRDIFRQKPQQEGALEPTIYRFILRYSLKDQIVVVALTLASFPILYLTLELPKAIINHAINGRAFPQPLLGIELAQISYLAALCVAFLALVLLNGWLKYRINVMKGRLGERMLRRLRYELYLRTLRFPLSHFSRIAAGEIIAMITSELEPVAGFIGDSFALPIYQGGTLLTIAVFMFAQNPFLGLAAVALYPVQGYVIPKLQRRVRRLGRRRVRRIRRLADRIGDSIADRVDIRTNDYTHYQLADISSQLAEIYDIRYEIYRRKFFIKFFNNFLNQLTPFFFYFVGGYFVIIGSLSFGALVAILAAYKDLTSPWKELLDFYQDQQDVGIKYEQVVEQFEVPGMIDPHILLDFPEKVAPLTGALVVGGVAYREPDGVTRLEGIDFDVPPPCRVAAVGPSNGGKFDLAALLARLNAPTAGRIEIGKLDINTVPMSVTGRRIGYSGPASYLHSGRLRDIVLMGLRHRPPSSATPQDGAGDDKMRQRREEARRTGSTDLDPGGDWIDYEQAGTRGAAELSARTLEILRRVDFETEVYGFSLLGRLEPERHPPETADGFVKARRRLREELTQGGLDRLIEPWDPTLYNANASVAENLLFGKPVGPTLGAEAMARQHYLRKILDATGLTQDLVLIGRHAAETMLEIFGEPNDHPGLTNEFSLVRADDVRSYRAILARAGSADSSALTPVDRDRLLSLACKLVAARHRLGLLDEAVRQRIVQARKRFADDLPAELHDAVVFFDPAQYNPAGSIEENIVFGKLAQGEADARGKVHGLIGKVLDELGLRELVIDIGLDFPVGTGGSRLSAAQRQKASLARALLKRPDLLVLNEATAALDGSSQTRVLQGLKQEFAAHTGAVFWSAHQLELASHFDNVLVIDGGRLVGQGPADALTKPGGALAGLLPTDQTVGGDGEKTDGELADAGAALRRKGQARQ